MLLHVVDDLGDLIHGERAHVGLDRIHAVETGGASDGRRFGHIPATQIGISEPGVGRNTDSLSW